MTRVVHKRSETSTICTENPAYEEIDVEKSVSPNVSYVQMTGRASGTYHGRDMTCMCIVPIVIKTMSHWLIYR